MNQAVDQIAGIRIGVVTDVPNRCVEEPFERQLLRAAKADPETRHYAITSDPMLVSMTSADAMRIISEKCSKGYKAIVALLGVPSSSDYESDIHKLLSAWSAGRKPALLLASAEPALTQKHVDSWPGWELLAKRLRKPVAEIRKAVTVNDEYIVAQGGEKALAQLKNCVKVATQLESVLTPPVVQPSEGVIEPDIKGAARACIMPLPA
jgi:hypothetical protein